MSIRVQLAQKILKGREPVIVVICGMPGTRKSSTAVMLGGLLRFGLVVGVDEIYEVMMLYERRKILKGKSHEAWKLFGPLNEKNFSRGMYLQAKAVKDGVDAVLKKSIIHGENTIIEGIHLIPSLYRGVKGAKIFRFLLVAQGLNAHQQLLKKKFERRHGRQAPWSERKILHLERVQSFLQTDAKKSKAKIIISTTPQKNCQAIMKYLNNFL